MRLSESSMLIFRADIGKTERDAILMCKNQQQTAYTVEASSQQCLTFILQRSHLKKRDPKCGLHHPPLACRLLTAHNDPHVRLHCLLQLVINTFQMTPFNLC